MKKHVVTEEDAVCAGMNIVGPTFDLPTGLERNYEATDDI
jgi:hypothetical protein